jgi:protein-S-isoprenylcysteine O-methyltransferase Ste14
MKLLVSALTKFICGIFCVGLLVFLPAGTLEFKGGWLFLSVLFIPIFIMGIVLLIKAPSLLEKRLNGKEKEDTQKGVVAFSGLIFVVGFIIAGLDFRFFWSFVPKWLVITAVILFLASYLIYAEVMRENAYLSRTIEVSDNQTVVDTGLYSVVRHPMYMATILMFLMIPLILGSFVSFIVFLGYPVIIAVRISNEEKVLTEQLKGYAEYKQKVKYKIIPFVW